MALADPFWADPYRKPSETGCPAWVRPYVFQAVDRFSGNRRMA